ncbi:MAG: stage II sporulation protein M [Deltaproteobacteria bacterium]|nr:MAG: stage II sporulation protein M [Deltaproteobacteria bacterium]
MNERDRFVERGRPRWEQLEELLRTPYLAAADWSRLATLYRGVCADLSRARSLSLSEDVLRYLDQLAGRAHNRLYSVRTGSGWSILRMAFVEAPAEIRSQWRFFLLASLLFYGPFFAGAGAALFDVELAYKILSEGQLAQMEAMYDDPNMVRGAGEDAAMAGFYVWNNVGIALRCFATGVLGGLGSMFFLVYNGLMIGTVFGYLFAVGNGWNLLAFTAGHSAWELTGIVVSGTAGLKLGHALIVTEGRTRTGSLRKAAPSLTRLVLGAALLLLVAAAIEGFWSASSLPMALKFAFGLVQVGIVGLWILLAGERRS